MARDSTFVRRVAIDAGRAWCLDMVQGLDAIVWEMDTDTGGFTFVSEGAERVLGYAAEHWYEDAAFWERVVVYPEDRADVIAARRQAMHTIGDQRISYRARAADGQLLTLTETLRMARDGRGSPSCLRGVTVVTSRGSANDRAIAARQARQQAALDASATGTFRWDLRSGALEWDDTLRVLFGGAPNRRPSAKELLEHIHADDQQRVAVSAWQCRDTGGDFREEFRVVRADGSVRSVLANGRTYLGDDAQPLYVTGSAVDVTELHRRADEFRELAEGLPQLAWLADETGWIFWYNQRWYDYTGTTLETMAGWGWRSVLHPEHLQRVVDRIRKAAATGEPWEDTFPLRRADGTYRWFLTRARPVRDSAQRIVRWIGTNTDVTDRLEIEAALRESEARVRQLFESLPVIVWTAQPNGALDYVGAQAPKFFGVESETLLGDGWQSIIHPDELADTWKRWRHALATGETFEMEYRMRGADDRYRWFLGRATPVRDGDGTIEKWFGTCTDIHDQKLAEEARDQALAELRVERQRLYDLFMQAPAAIAVTEGPEHIFAVANPRFRRMVGNRDLLWRPAAEAFADLADAGVVRWCDEVYRTGRAFVGSEVPSRFTPDGRGPEGVEYLNVICQPLRGADGVVHGLMIHAVDVTEQVMARREVERKAEELAQLTTALERSNRELDQFAYVASHDLKAPLRGIANLAQWIEEDSGETLSSEARAHLRLLHGRVRRMDGLIEGILTYARAAQTRAEPSAIDLGVLANEIVELLGPPEGVVFSIAPDAPTVLAERVPLQQVLMNLVANAVKHGRADDPRVDIAWRDLDSEVEVSVTDNGPGIAPEFHERVWGIFQRLVARDKVEGTGIGLAVVRKIVESRGGRAWVESMPGTGATFRFTWPKSVGSA